MCDAGRPVLLQRWGITRSFAPPSWTTEHAGRIAAQENPPVQKQYVIPCLPSPNAPHANIVDEQAPLRGARANAPVMPNNSDHGANQQGSFGGARALALGRPREGGGAHVQQTSDGGGPKAARERARWGYLL